jgi:hypothetical protein
VAKLKTSLRHGATVIPVRHRQIAATRNSGARAARGERLFFVDADTRIHSRVVASALHQMDRGAVGGGAPAWFDRNVEASSTTRISHGWPTMNEIMGVDLDIQPTTENEDRHA